MLIPYTKRIAYVHHDEIVAVSQSPDLPFRWDRLTFASGEAKGKWIVRGVERIEDKEFDALVHLRRIC